MVGCRKLSLYAKWVSGWACDLFSAMIEKTCRVNHFFDILQWCYFSGIEAFELKSIEVDKVESKKHLASKSVSFLVQLISSSFLDLIFKQGRLNPLKAASRLFISADAGVSKFLIGWAVMSNLLACWSWRGLVGDKHDAGRKEMRSTGINFGRSNLFQSCSDFTVKPELETTVNLV